MTDSRTAPPGRRFGGLLVDPTPLRLDHDFRLLWIGQAISTVGRMITSVVLPYQVYVLTGDILAVGALSLIQLFPIMIFALGGGAVADAVDRRKLLLYTQLGLAACSLAFVGIALMPSPRSPRSTSSRSRPPASAPSTSRHARRRSRASCRWSGFPRRSGSTSWCSTAPR